MAEFIISYNYRGYKTRRHSFDTYPTLDKAKKAVKSLMADDGGSYYYDFVIGDVTPVITVKLPEPTWIEVKKVSE